MTERPRSATDPRQRSGGADQPSWVGSDAARHNAHRVRVGTLSDRRCEEKIRAGEVGRVAWNSAHGPQLFPVSYAWCDDLIVFRTSPTGILSELTRRTSVVFEIDELQMDGHTGWSVLARGQAGAIASPAQLTRMWTVDGVDPWAPGLRNLFIGIAVDQLTGRVFAPQRPAFTPALTDDVHPVGNVRAGHAPSSLSP
ncbi:pyridoxamine 5'-phosphate oxidase family protein [Terracoccus luteus]|uniref:pyridoxamine 5'-phosphate oxidase family protein n=1 Tax=Terracoccus luteus TaxID=53356 RepID=UPI0021A69670|nr:pyridoxamine 5'-phosphate oxidase family protein [Terracoccus luteus]